jgi:hypothetical protein
MPDADPEINEPGAFCHVEKRERSGSRHFVVHTQSPRFVVEMESSSTTPDGRRMGVIKRVCVPNSWAGDYQKCGRALGAALAFFESPPAQLPTVSSINHVRGRS